LAFSFRRLENPFNHELKMKKNGLKTAGIDFGAKGKNTTALSYSVNTRLVTELSPMKEDTDAWIFDRVKSLGFDQLFIDAPLSLPRIYIDPKDTKSTFQLRSCDQELGAMSPMFLGGLTARAMALQSACRSHGIDCFETYPKALLIKRFQTKERSSDVVSHIARKTKVKIDLATLSNPHIYDSLLAWYAGWIYTYDNPLVIGRKKEGRIYL